VSATVIWHDLECGAYAEDLPLWRSLAASRGDPLLDVGAGTGRVALDLAAAGYQVTALDRDPELLDALQRRALGRNTEIVPV
jgi:precorrin-6B methylase 2